MKQNLKSLKIILNTLGMAHYIFFGEGKGWLNGGNIPLQCVFYFQLCRLIGLSTRGSHKQTSVFWHEFENKPRTTVKCFLHFISLFCSLARYCNPHSNRFLDSLVSICQHFSSHDRLHADRSLCRASCALLWRSVSFLVNF